MKKNHSYLIKGINNPTAKILRVTCIDITKKTYLVSFNDGDTQYIEKESISESLVGIEGWRIVEDLGILPINEEE